MLADPLKDATSLLHSIERTAKEIELYLNSDKTEFIFLNQDPPEGMMIVNGDEIKQVDDFKYLGSYIASTEHDVNIRLANAWGALNELDKIWKSNLPNNLKRKDGAYKRMLRAALKIL